MIIKIILLSAIAGVFGTGLGAIVSATLIKRSTENMTCWMLSFAAGVMTSIVCFGLAPEAFALSGVYYSILGLCIGVVVIMVLNRIVDKATKTTNDDLDIHHTYAEMYHESNIIKNREKLLRSGTMMLIAIGLHNIPEGIAIGAGGTHDIQFGILLTIMIALHNIPEGMAIATPLLAGGVRVWKTILWTGLAGAPTLIGGIIGVLIGSISDLAIALSLSAAGGAMLYVVFGEIIPQSVIMTKNRIASLVTLFGIIIGLIITKI